MLCNIDQFPQMYEFSSKIVNQFLGVARRAIEHQTYTNSGAVILEKYFDYDKNTFEAKLEEIYDFYRNQAARMKPWELDEARADIVNDRIHSGPYNQNDGAWLRFIANTETLDDMRGFLFDVWSDEFDNGNPALHHGNLFTTFLRGLNITLPGVATRAYADHPKFNDADFCSPVFQMAISQNSDRYFPEIIGMTLFLEWEVLELAQTIKKLDYHGIDSQFWRMHVGIDNAVDGHGAKARNAVNVYLDNVLKESGRAAMQREWKRIWTGFVAFATAGMNYLGIDGVVDHRRPPSMTDKIKSLMARKQHYGSLNHGWHLDRPLFERQLIEAAVQGGAVLIEHCTRIDAKSGPAGWLFRIDKAGRSLGVGGVVLVALDVSLHVLCRHQLHLVAELHEFTCPIMG